MRRERNGAARRFVMSWLRPRHTNISEQRQVQRQRRQRPPEGGRYKCEPRQCATFWLKV